MNIPVELKKAITDNDIVVFVGAGLSYNLINKNNKQLCGWKNLVLSIIEELKNTGYNVDINLIV